jgi:ribonuclease HII
MDEAGRGPLAGPVYAAAAVLPNDFPSDILNDSKKLSEQKRDEAAALIKKKAAYGIAFASHTEIDKLNILTASLLAMRRAYAALLAAFPNADISEIIVDGIYSPWSKIDSGNLPPVRAVPKADGTYPAVMAASILAKTARDAEMLKLAKQYPEYRFEQHKGYPTKLHRELIAKFGASPVHRLSFRLLDDAGPGLF